MSFVVTEVTHYCEGDGDAPEPVFCPDMPDPPPANVAEAPMIWRVGGMEYARACPWCGEKLPATLGELYQVTGIALPRDESKALYLCAKCGCTTTDRKRCACNTPCTCLRGQDGSIEEQDDECPEHGG